MAPILEVCCTSIASTLAAQEGARAVELLADLVKKAGDRVIIMPGAGLTPDNIKDIHRRVKAKEYYSTLSKAFESLMLYRRKCVYLSGLPEVPEYSWNQTLPEVIRAFLDELK